ncbi:MAG: hypothetical protein ACJ07L_15210 [Opitutales bacterium]
MKKDAVVALVDFYGWQPLISQEMTCCICRFVGECLGPTAMMLSRWDFGSGGLLGLEHGLVVWRDGVDAVPAICFDCQSSQRDIAPV